MSGPAAVDQEARAAARQRLDGLAKPWAPWAASRSSRSGWPGSRARRHPRPPAEVAVVVFAGDHGVTTGTSPVSAYPRQVTALMVREFLRGGAAVTVLARAHGARVRVLDLGVDDDLTGVPAEVVEHKVRRGSGAIDREDALTADQVEAALASGRRVADEEIDAGADLLVPGDMGIGNTTVAATLVGALLGLRAADVVGRGTGVDDPTLDAKRAVVDAAIDRAAPHRTTRSPCCASRAAPTWPRRPASWSRPSERGRRCCWTG